MDNSSRYLYQPGPYHPNINHLTKWISLGYDENWHPDDENVLLMSPQFVWLLGVADFDLTAPCNVEWLDKIF